ncbi:MAG: hypothetical protein LBF92_10670 [Synergistaceae bacterium]|jgi:hypothetical protein|nr:hypothetical protein [Synergistaceae bacterium]
MRRRSWAIWAVLFVLVFALLSGGCGGSGGDSGDFDNPSGSETPDNPDNSGDWDSEFITALEGTWKTSNGIAQGVFEGEPVTATLYEMSVFEVNIAHIANSAGTISAGDERGDIISGDVPPASDEPGDVISGDVPPDNDEPGDDEPGGSEPGSDEPGGDVSDDDRIEGSSVQVRSKWDFYFGSNYYPEVDLNIDARFAERTGENIFRFVEDYGNGDTNTVIITLDADQITGRVTVSCDYPSVGTDIQLSFDITK